MALQLFRQEFPECTASPKKVQDFLTELIGLLFISERPPGALFAIPSGFKVPDIVSRRFYIKSVLASKYGLYPDLFAGQKDYSNTKIRVNSPILGDLFSLYDYYFSGHTFSAYLSGSTIDLEFSDILTTTGGKCRFVGNGTYLLKISAKILTDIVPTSQGLEAGGIAVQDRLDGLMLIFEHEFVHLLMQVIKIEDTGNHGPIFRQLLQNLFGQTVITHGLVNRQTSQKFSLGQTVYFSLRKESVSGIIQKLNPKTAHVRTIQGDYRVPYVLLQS